MGDHIWVLLISIVILSIESVLSVTVIVAVVIVCLFLFGNQGLK